MPNQTLKKNEDQASAQNAKMNQERKFLSEMLEESFQGNGLKVKSLVSKYSKDHKVTCYEVLSQFKDGNKRTALHFACQGRRKNESSDDDEKDILSVLLESNWLSQSSTESLLRLKDKEGFTCLMNTAQHPDRTLSYERTKLLLKVGGTKLALARSKAGATPLHYAAGVGASRDTIKLLYQAGKVALGTNSKMGGTPLHWIAGTSPKAEKEDDFAEALCALIDDCEADINAPNEQGMPPLILAAAANNDKHACILVERGADPTKILPGNVTVFHMAADLNLIRTLKALLDLSQDSQNVAIAKYVQMKNNQGETPLNLAANEGHIGCVMLLLPNGNNSEEEARRYISEYQSSTKSNSQNTDTPSDPTVPKPQTPISSPESSLKELDEQTKNKVTQILENKSNVTTEQIDEALEHKKRGNQYFAKKDYSQSIHEYTAAIQINPSDATFYSNRSASFHHIKNFSQALEDAYLAKHLKTDWSKPYFRMAMVQLSMEEYEEAACSAWEGLQRDSSNAELKALLQKCVKMGKKVHHESIAKEKKEKKEKMNKR